LTSQGGKRGENQEQVQKGRKKNQRPSLSNSLSGTQIKKEIRVEGKGQAGREWRGGEVLNVQIAKWTKSTKSNGGPRVAGTGKPVN